MHNRGGICPACGGNMFHGNACKYGATVSNSSSYEHRKYGNMFKENPMDKHWREQKEYQDAVARAQVHKHKKK